MQTDRYTTIGMALGMGAEFAVERRPKTAALEHTTAQHSHELSNRGLGAREARDPLSAIPTPAQVFPDNGSG
jgi:hypothetical protein